MNQVTVRMLRQYHLQPIIRLQFPSYSHIHPATLTKNILPSSLHKCKSFLSVMLLLYHKMGVHNKKQTTTSQGLTSVDKKEITQIVILQHLLFSCHHHHHYCCYGVRFTYCIEINPKTGHEPFTAHDKSFW